MRLFQSLFVVLFLVCLFGEKNSIAQTPGAFPYQGYLEFGGAPFNGQVNMFFYIVSDEDVEVAVPGLGEALGGALGEPQGEIALWSTAIEGVTVSQGNFHVTLGNGDAFPEELFSSNTQLFLGVKVFYNDAWVELRQKQRLLPVPYALHAKKAEQADVATTAIRADDFAVDGVLHAPTVQGGDLTLDGTLRAPTVQGQMLINGGEVGGANDAGAPLQVKDGTHRMVFDGDEIESNTTLHLQIHGDRKTHVGGELEVDGLLRLKDDKYVRGFRIRSPDEVRTNRGVTDSEVIGSTSNSFCFLTRVHMYDLNDGDEGAECEVKINGNNWELWAYSRGGDRGEAVCQAKCVQWNW